MKEMLGISAFGRAQRANSFELQTSAALTRPGQWFQLSTDDLPGAW